MLVIPTQDAQSATPEFKNMFRYASGLIAHTLLTPVYYQGIIAGSEFEAYNAGKLYIAMELEADFGALATVERNLALYDQANSLSFRLVSSIVYFNAGVYYYGNNIIKNNCYFSRLVSNGYSNISFNGYRLNV